MISPHQRSAFPTIRGFNGATSLLLGILFSFSALLAQNGTDYTAPPLVTIAIVTLISMLCVIFVRTSSIFVAATQSPIVIVFCVIVYYLLTLKAPFRQKILTIGMQLAQYFPAILVAFSASVICGLIRWYLQHQWERQELAAHLSTPRTPRTSSTSVPSSIKYSSPNQSTSLSSRPPSPRARNTNKSATSSSSKANPIDINQLASDSAKRYVKRPSAVRNTSENIPTHNDKLFPSHTSSYQHNTSDEDKNSYPHHSRIDFTHSSPHKDEFLVKEPIDQSYDALPKSNDSAYLPSSSGRKATFHVPPRHAQPSVPTRPTH